MANTYNTKNYFASGTAPYVADSEATTVANLKNDFNALLAALRTAGVLSATAPAATEPETTDPETPAEGTEGGGS